MSLLERPKVFYPVLTNRKESLRRLKKSWNPLQRLANTLNTFITSCKGIQDIPGFWIPCYWFQIPGSGFQSLSVELGFWIPIASGIPDSLSGIRDSKTKDSGIPKLNFPRLQIPQAKIFRSRIRIPLHWATSK